MGSSVKTAHIQDDVLRIVDQCKSHFSILAIKNENLGNQFLFGSMPKSENKEEILNLDVSKASLKINKFPSCMELSNVTPAQKKGSQSENGNYRSVGILSNSFKVFERCIYEKTSEYFQNILP